MHRYLINRKTQQVFIWTPLLAKEGELEEVFADSATTALTKETIPDPRNITLAQIEKMKKADLLMFAELKLQLRLSAEWTIPQLQERIKEAIFNFSAEEKPPVPEKKDARVDANQ